MFVVLQILMNALWTTETVVDTQTVLTSRVPTVAPVWLDSAEMDSPAQVRFSFYY